MIQSKFPYFTMWQKSEKIIHIKEIHIKFVKKIIVQLRRYENVCNNMEFLKNVQVFNKKNQNFEKSPKSYEFWIFIYLKWYF